MDVSRETPDDTTMPKCHDLTNILVLRDSLRDTSGGGPPDKIRKHKYEQQTKHMFETMAKHKYKHVYKSKQ